MLQVDSAGRRSVVRGQLTGTDTIEWKVVDGPVIVMQDLPLQPLLTAFGQCQNRS